MAGVLAATEAWAEAGGHSGASVTDFGPRSVHQDTSEEMRLPPGRP